MHPEAKAIFPLGGWIHLRPWPCTRAPSRPMVSEIPMLRAPYISNSRENELSMAAMIIEPPTWVTNTRRRCILRWNCASDPQFLHLLQFFVCFHDVPCHQVSLRHPLGQGMELHLRPQWKEELRTTLGYLATTYLDHGSFVAAGCGPLHLPTLWGDDFLGCWRRGRIANKPLHCHWRMWSFLCQPFMQKPKDLK